MSNLEEPLIKESSAASLYFMFQEISYTEAISWKLYKKKFYAYKDGVA